MTGRKLLGALEENLVIKECLLLTERSSKKYLTIVNLPKHGSPPKLTGWTRSAMIKEADSKRVGTTSLQQTIQICMLETFFKKLFLNDDYFVQKPKRFFF